MLAARSTCSSLVNADAMAATARDVAINMTTILELDVSAPLQTHVVQVSGLTDNSFAPDHVAAAIGDIVRFEFCGGNVSISQSSIRSPCRRSGSFDTGFQGVKEKHRGFVDLQIVTTSPQWFFCQEAKPRSHCAPDMTFVVNPRKDSGSLPQSESSRVSQTVTATGDTSDHNDHTISTTNVQESSVLPYSGGARSVVYTYIDTSVKACSWPTQYPSAPTGTNTGSTGSISGCIFPQATNRSWNWPTAINVNAIKAPLEGHIAPCLKQSTPAIAVALLLWLITNCVLSI